MIVMRTGGGDICTGELKVGLVLWLSNSYRNGRLQRDATPEPLDGNGARLYQIIHATDEERAMLREAGVKVQDVDLRWLEAHRRPGYWVRTKLRDASRPTRTRKTTRPKSTKRKAAANVVPLVRAA